MERAIFKDKKTLLRLVDDAPKHLMLLFVFLSPFAQFTAVKEICFYSSAVLWMGTIVYRRSWARLSTPLTLPLLLILAWSVAGIPAALNKPNTIHDIFGHWMKDVIFYYLLINYFHRAADFRRLVFVVVLAACIYPLWYIGFFYLYLGHAWSDRMVLYTYSDFFFVLSSVAAIGLIQQQKDTTLRYLGVIALPLNVAAAILTQYRSAVLAIALGTAVYMLRFRKLGITVMALLMIGLVSYPTFRERLEWGKLVHNDRISTNLITLEIIKDHPLFGIGFGMQTYGDPKYIDLRAYAEKVPEKYRNGILLGSPHNLLMDVTVRLGILGGVIWLFLYICEGRMLFHMYRYAKTAEIKRWSIILAASFGAFLVQSQFGDAAWGVQAFVFFTILAMTSIMWHWQVTGKNAIDRTGSSHIPIQPAD